mmetsp:Transcript_15431/g.17766  ORF Transcript_15431/g.17766 Transcript_15431/m.17766 type:complete len:257 (-) Transcript_15431:97-867(-)
MKVVDETSTLLASAEEGTASVLHLGSGPLPDIKNVTTKQRFVDAAATISVGMQVTTMLLYGSKEAYVNVSSGLGCLIAPVCAMQQHTITTVAKLNESRERLDGEVVELSEANKKLKSELNELEKVVDKLEDVEEALTVIKETKSHGIDMLEAQVKRSKDILDKMEQHVESHILQNILSTIFKVDKKSDGILDDDDISALLVNISMLHGVEVNEDLFRKKIRKSDRSINAVLEIVKNLLGEDDPAGERIFVFSSSNI